MLRSLVIFISALLVTLNAHGQTLYGMVVNGETAKPLTPVTIVNISTQQSVITDAQGNFTLPAKDGEIISFSFIGFRTTQREAVVDKYLVVEMFPLSVKLKEYILHPDYTRFQRDSAEMAERYSKELNTQKVKPGFSSANGGGFSGLIGSPVQKMSKSYKQNKKFKENYQKDMEQKYIDTRYKPGLVTALTGYRGDSLAVFMNTYPMAYDFARSATDLEIKMWIRNNHKQYLHKKNQ